MISQRRNIELPLCQQRKQMQPATSKPTTSYGLRVPALPFIPVNQFQNHNDTTSTLTPRMTQAPINTANRTLPSNRLCNNSTIVNGFVRDIPNQSHRIYVPQNTKAMVDRSNRRDNPVGTTYMMPISNGFDKTQLIQMRQVNDTQPMANAEYIKRHSGTEWVRNPNQRRTRVKQNSVITSEWNDVEFSADNNNKSSRSNNEEASKPTSNYYLLKEKTQIEDIQYESTLDYVKEASFNRETEKLRVLLCDRQAQILKLMNSLEQSRISEALQGRKIQGLEALVELINKTIQNDSRNNQSQNLKENRSLSCQKDRVQRIKGLEEYKAKFDQLSQKSDKIYQDCRISQATLQISQRTIANLQKLLAKANLDLVHRNNAIMELSSIYKHNESMMLNQLQIITNQMTTYYGSLNDDIPKRKALFDCKQNPLNNQELTFKVIQLTAQNNQLRSNILELENKLVKANLVHPQIKIVSSQEVLEHSEVLKTPNKNRQRPELSIVKEQFSLEPVSERKNVEPSESNGTQINFEAVVTQEELTKLAHECSQLRKEIESSKKIKLMYEEIRIKYRNLRDQCSHKMQSECQQSDQHSIEEHSQFNSSRDTIPIADDCLKIKLYYEEMVEGLHQRRRELQSQVQTLKAEAQMGRTVPHQKLNIEKENILQGQEGCSRCRSLTKQYDQLAFRYSLNVNHLSKERQRLLNQLSITLSDNRLLTTYLSKSQN